MCKLCDDYSQYIPCTFTGPVPCDGAIMRDLKKKKKKAQVTNWSDLVCLMCPFFVPKVIRNLVALLMYSERYWLINALSAHNPLGSVRGTGEKTCIFSQCVFSPLAVVQKTSGFFCFFSPLATFKGQKAEYLPSNAFKTTLVLMNVNSITLKSLTRDCSSISSLPVLTLKDYLVGCLHLH